MKIKVRVNPKGLMNSASKEHRDKTVYRRKEKYKGRAIEIRWQD
jgi:hypothetical protein